MTKMSRAVPNSYPNRIQQGLLTNLVIQSTPALSAAESVSATADDLPGDIEGGEEVKSEGKSEAFPVFGRMGSMLNNRKMTLRRDK